MAKKPKAPRVRSLSSTARSDDIPPALQALMDDLTDYAQAARLGTVMKAIQAEFPGAAIGLVISRVDENGDYCTPGLFSKVSLEDSLEIILALADALEEKLAQRKPA